MKEQNKKLTIAEPIAERLRNGEKVICAKCKKGYYVTDAQIYKYKSWILLQQM